MDKTHTTPSLIWVCPPITIRILEEEIDHVLLTWRDNSSSTFLLQDIVRQTNTHKSFNKMTYFLTWAWRLNSLICRNYYCIQFILLKEIVKLNITNLSAFQKYFVKLNYTFFYVLCVWFSIKKKNDFTVFLPTNPIIIKFRDSSYCIASDLTKKIRQSEKITFKSYRIEWFHEVYNLYFISRNPRNNVNHNCHWILSSFSQRCNFYNITCQCKNFSH